MDARSRKADQSVAFARARIAVLNDIENGSPVSAVKLSLVELDLKVHCLLSTLREDPELFEEYVATQEMYANTVAMVSEYMYGICSNYNSSRASSISGVQYTRNADKVKAYLASLDKDTDHAPGAAGLVLSGHMQQTDSTSRAQADAQVPETGESAPLCEPAGDQTALQGYGHHQKADTKDRQEYPNDVEGATANSDTTWANAFVPDIATPVIVPESTEYMIENAQQFNTGTAPLAHTNNSMDTLWQPGKQTPETASQPVSRMQSQRTRMQYTHTQPLYVSQSLSQPLPSCMSQPLSAYQYLSLPVSQQSLPVSQQSLPPLYADQSLSLPVSQQ
eukprot:scpid42345/ scgid21666/ 